MELRHLRYFVAVVEAQSFTRAAEKLFIAQPPLSRQIQNLEAELGVQLFERGSRPLKTTEAGHFFYEHACTLLSNSEQLKTMTQRIALVEKTISIGFVSSLLYGMLAKIVYLFRQQQPHLKIELVELSTTQQIQALKEGRIDVGFGRLKIADPAVRRVLLRNEPLYVAAHASHHFCSKADGVYLSEIINEKLFLYPNIAQPNFSTQVTSLFSDFGLALKNSKDVRDVSLALGFVAAGDGVCVVPKSASNIHLPHLNFIPILDEGAVTPIFMTVRNMDPSEEIRALLDCVFQVHELEGIPSVRQNL